MFNQTIQNVLSDTVFDARTQIDLELIMDPEGTLDLSSEPQLFAGYATLEDIDFESDFNPTLKPTYSVQLQRFLLGKAKAQIAYNLIRLIKSGFWNEENLPEDYERQIDYELIDEIQDFTLDFAFAFIEPALRELEQLHYELEDTFINTTEGNQPLFIENPNHSISYILNHNVSAALRQNKLAKIELVYNEDLDVFLKIERFYKILNIFDTFQDKSTEYDNLQETVARLERVQLFSATRKDFQELITKDTRYANFDSRLEFTRKASEESGYKAMVIVDIGGMNVANRGDRGRVAETFVDVLLNNENMTKDI
jgi:hypothetical protein